MRAVRISLAMMVACSSWAKSPKSSGAPHDGPSAKTKSTKTTRASQYLTRDPPLPVTILISPDDAATVAKRQNEADQFNRCSSSHAGAGECSKTSGTKHDQFSSISGIATSED
jgi:hypothetical protein